MKVPIEIAVAYSLMRKRAEENAKFDLVAWIRNKIKTKGTIMEEKVTIIQTSNTSEGTTIKLAPDVAYIEATFEDRLVSRVIVKMKGL